MTKTTLEFAGDLRIEDLALSLPSNGIEAINMREVNFIFPSAITALAALLHEKRKKGHSIDVELPSASSGIAGYLKRIRFDELAGVNIDVTQREHPPEGRFVELTFIDSSDKKDEFTMQFLREVFEGELEKDLISEILSATSELLENVLLHSGDNPWCIAMAQKYRSTIEVSISDRGIGIRESLSRNRDFDIPFDALAVQLAVRRGITRDSEKFAGEGLWKVKNFAVKQNGFFWLWSGNGLFTASPWTQGAGTVPGYWHGTTVGFYFKRHGWTRL